MFKLGEEEFKVIDEYMTDIITDLLNKTKEQIIKKELVNTGNLLQSGFIIDNFLSKELIYDAPYAKSLEFGRLPGNLPPIDPLVEWIKQKGLSKGKKKDLSFAWAIAKKMEVLGTAPRPFFRDAIIQFISENK